MNFSKIDHSRWKRAEHYQFFKDFDEPFFGLTAEVDCSIGYQKAKDKNWSVFQYYLYESLRALNEVEELRYRIRENEVVIFDKIHASTTAIREDETFAFTFIPFEGEFTKFTEKARSEFEQVKNSTGIRISEHTSRLDVAHYSSIPWVYFTSLSHARKFSFPDSMPKITFGKFRAEGKHVWLPVSIHCHHALADGYHVAKFLSLFQDFLNE